MPEDDEFYHDGWEFDDYADLEDSVEVEWYAVAMDEDDWMNQFPKPSKWNRFSFEAKYCARKIFRKIFPSKCSECGQRYGHVKGCDPLPF